jgi:hypothetical protein
VLDARCIEITTTLKPVLVAILGRENMDSLEEFLLDPDGPIANLAMWRIKRLLTLNVDAYSTSGCPPFIAVLAQNVTQLRTVFEWLYGVPIDFEVPCFIRKRDHQAINDA